MSAASRGGARALERWFRWLCAGAVAVPIGLLALLLIEVAIAGLADFDAAVAAALGPALFGSVALVSVTAVIALPIGVGAAIYLEEYADGRFVARLIEFNVNNLASVPSVVYGLLGLELFARTLDLGLSLVAGALTMALLVLPIVIAATRAALRGVPASLREAGLALGATRWQVVRRIVLPNALPGILTGALWAVSRALGEAAPILVLGALAYGSVAGSEGAAEFTVLPVRIYDWIARPEHARASEAAAGIVVLLLLLLLLNGFAIVLRDRAARAGEGEA